MNRYRQNMMELEEVRRIFSSLNVNREPLRVKRRILNMVEIEKVRGIVKREPLSQSIMN